MNNSYLHNHKDVSGVIGEHLQQKKKYLLDSISEMNISHAYLFLGSPYSKKEELLEWFIQMIPHEECMRIIPEDDSYSLGIEKIRVCKDMVSRTSFGGGKRIIIIENSEKLTPEASNALLKILEEPDNTTHFILTAVNEYQILPTILSRCQRIQLYAPPEEPDTSAQYATLRSLLFSQPLWNQLEEGKNLTDADIYRSEHVLHTEFSSNQNKNIQIIEWYDRLVELRKRTSHHWVSSYSHDVLFLPLPI